LKKTAEILLRDYDGDIPPTLDELMALPGIGPKMAYLIMQEAWNKNEGIGVDTHVHRIANRLGWVRTAKQTPEHTRKQLEEWLPKRYWRHVNVMLVGFGQTLCRPIGPKCSECPVAQLCPKVGTKAKKM
jgi:endonuclease-3